MIQLARYGENAEPVARLRERMIVAPSVVPFVGAGLSIPWKFPGWVAFLQRLAEKAHVAQEVERLLRDNRFEPCADLLADRLGASTITARIRTVFGDSIIRRPKYISAVELLPRLPLGPVVTTNFDRVLEHVFGTAAKAFDLVLWGGRASLGEQALGEDCHILLKLHGDAQDSSDQTLTGLQYDQHYGTSPEERRTQPLPRLLRRLFQSRSVLFLGCSMGGDRYTDIAAEARAEGLMPEHFAMVEPASTARGHRRQIEVMAEAGITPIWLPAGQYQLLTEFLEESTRSSSSRAASHRVPIAPILRSAGFPRIKARSQDQAIRKRDRLWREWKQATSDEAKLSLIDRYGRYLYDHHLTDIYVAWARVGARIVRRAGNRELEAELWNNSALALRRAGGARNRGAAHRLLARADALLEGYPKSPLRVQVAHNRALEAMHRGDFADAAAGFARALAIAAEVGLRDVAPILRALAEARAELGSPEAEDLAKRAGKLSRANGDVKGEAYALIAIGQINFRAGRWRRARDASRKALELIYPGGTPKKLARAFDNIGAASLALRDLPGAVRAFLQALSFEQKTDDLEGLATTLLNLGWAHYLAACGEPGLRPLAKSREMREMREMREASLERSDEYLEQAVAVARALRSRHQSGMALAYRAAVRHQRGKRSDALSMLAKAIKVFPRWDHVGLAHAYNNLGIIYSDRPQERSLALRMFKVALRHARRANDRVLTRTIERRLQRIRSGR